MEPTNGTQPMSTDLRSASVELPARKPQQGGLQEPGWQIAWEYIAPVVVALVVLIASLATEWSKAETILWTIVSYLLTQTLAFQVIDSKERETIRTTLNSVLSDRSDKLNHIVDLTTQQPRAARLAVIETLRSFYPAMGIQDKCLQIHRDRAVLTTFADAVLKRADDDLNQILSKGTYTMSVATPSEDYVRRWYDLMASLDLKDYENAEFITMSNIVIWSSDYFGRTAYGNLQSKSKMRIRRIFVVPSNTQLENDKPLALHLQSVLREYVDKIHSADVDAKDSPGKPQKVQTKIYVPANADEYRAHFIEGRDHHSSNFAIWRISDDTNLVLTVDYLQEKGDTNFQVAGITFGLSSFEPSSLDTADKEESFRRRWESPATISIQDYLKTLDEKIKS